MQGHKTTDYVLDVSIGYAAPRGTERAENISAIGVGHIRKDLVVVPVARRGQPSAAQELGIDWKEFSVIKRPVCPCDSGEPERCETAQSQRSNELRLHHTDRPTAHRQSQTCCTPNR